MRPVAQNAGALGRIAKNPDRERHRRRCRGIVVMAPARAHGFSHPKVLEVPLVLRVRPS